jgi:pimeloyl-ACP methyl ester carboxylesterase/uncharacterized protein YukE
MMYGADVDELRALSQQLKASANALQGTRRRLGGQLRSVPWRGQRADEFRAAWDRSYATALHEAAGRLLAASRTLIEQAAQQERAHSSDPNRIVFTDSTEPCRLQTGLDGASTAARVSNFERRSSGRADIVEAFYATADPRRADPTQIEIRRLDNGRYIVVLPGVNDLSEGWEAGKAGAVSGVADGAVAGVGAGIAGVAVAGTGVGIGRGVAGIGAVWGRDDPSSVRRMKHAADTARGGNPSDNPYARRVKEQMEAAGIPPGADVMIIGHSYGAYTAMDIAADKDFNRISGDDSYHVHVTHVIAVGADTDWRASQVPEGTKTLIVNNRLDAAYQSENPLHRDVAFTGGRQVERTFAGGGKGLGHHPDNYANYLGSTPDPAVTSWMNEAGAMYQGGGTAEARQVVDVP